MLIQTDSANCYRYDTFAYVFDSAAWNIRKLHALSFTKKSLSVTDSQATMSIVGGMGSLFSAPLTAMAWLDPGYVPATVIGATATTGLLGMCIPLIARKLRSPRQRRAFDIATDRRNAIIMREGCFGDDWTANAYSMTALFKTPISEKLCKIFTANVAKSKDDILAQLSADESSGSLFMRFKPVLDEYFRSTTEMDIELKTARNKDETSRPIQEITKNEQEIDEFAAEVADELASIAKIYEEEVNTQSKTSMEMASDNLRMARQAFRAQRGNYMPEH